ncbi:TonB-dependent receptor, partial [Neisseria gonorrhoeae]
MGQFMSVFRINMTAATVLAALSSPVFAAQTADLETVHIKG